MTTRQSSRTLKDKARKKVKKNFKQLKTYKVEFIDPTSVYPNIYNPNRQSDDEFKLLCSSMREDGFTQPILVNKKDRVIVDGEHRWRAAQHLNLEEIPAVMADMTEAQMRISTLRHNRARGNEDLELTVSIMQDLQTLGALDKAAKSLDISDQEMQVLLDDLPAPDAQAYEEFTNSWIPDIEIISVEGEYKSHRKEFEASSPEAYKRQVETSDAAASAKTEFERQDILREKRNEVALPAVFNADQYDFVTAMIGDAFALKLIRLCEYHTTKAKK